MTTMAPENRLFTGLQLRDVDTTESLSMIEGKAVPYGVQTNTGWYLEDFAPKAFAKSITEAARDLPFLLFHDSRTFSIGAADEWKEEKDGLIGRWRLDGSDMAQRAAQQAKDGFLTGLSVGFMPIRSTWTYPEDWNPDLGPEHMDRVTRLEARLLEVSLVSTPAYAEAGVTLVRSADGRQRKRAHGERPAVSGWRAELEKLRG